MSYYTKLGTDFNVEVVGDIPSGYVYIDGFSYSFISISLRNVGGSTQVPARALNNAQMDT